MPKFNIHVTFSLETEIEPDNVRFDYGLPSGVEEIEDDSSFYREGVTSSGGELRFTVEAEDEYAAEEIANEVVSDGREVEDDSGITWQVTDFDIEIEPVEEEMTKDKAREVLAALLQRLVMEQRLSEVEKDAIEFLIDTL